MVIYCFKANVIKSENEFIYKLIRRNTEHDNSIFQSYILQSGNKKAAL